MKPKEILVFGASGQIGRHLIRKFTKNNYKVIAVTRNIHQKGYLLKTQANPGYLEVEELKHFDEEKIKNLMSNCSVCINLIGILYEKKKNEFNFIHTYLPNLIAKFAKEKKVPQLIHVSSLGIDDAKDSNYAKSKIEGEKNVFNNFENAVILKPSIVYSVDDNFTTNFMSLLSNLPFMPLYYSGLTKFAPIHVSDLANIILSVVEKNIKKMKIECVGPEIFTFKEIMEKLLYAINKKRFLIPIPLSFAKISAKILEKFPKPLLTTDQLNLLKYHNIPSGLNKTNHDLNLKTERKFDIEIEKYSYNWRVGGQYSKIKKAN